MALSKVVMVLALYAPCALAADVEARTTRRLGPRRLAMLEGSARSLQISESETMAAAPAPVADEPIANAPAPIVTMAADPAPIADAPVADEPIADPPAPIVTLAADPAPIADAPVADEPIADAPAPIVTLAADPAPIASAPAPAATVSREFEQCGGLDWEGPTMCAEDLDCVYDNQYYSQCQCAPSSLPPSLLHCFAASCCRFAEQCFCQRAEVDT